MSDQEQNPSIRQIVEERGLAAVIGELVTIVEERRATNYEWGSVLISIRQTHTFAKTVEGYRESEPPAYP